MLARMFLPLISLVFVGLATPALAGQLSVSATSQNGLYMVTAAPADGDASVGPIHVWKLVISDAQGNPVTGAKVGIDGGMPGHGHGLPTAPETTSEPEAGVYLIDGVKFSMTGEWELRFAIDGTAGSDTAIAKFNIQ